jgi:hypothetical protein
VLTINGAAPPAHLAGRKDVIHVPGGNSVVRFITKFETFYDHTIPYMYHCHMLMHEDDGMMGQFLVKSPCALQINAQPSNVQTEIGSNVQFSVVATSPDPISYQWQTDIGFGWQNISNAGQYSGVSTSTLTVSSTSLANNNQLFRCQIQISDGCISNSQQALLEVGTSGLSNIDLTQLLVFPNPSNQFFNISSSSTKNQITVVDFSGRIIAELNSEESVFQLDAATWEAGTYFLMVNGEFHTKLIKY